MFSLVICCYDIDQRNLKFIRVGFFDDDCFPRLLWPPGLWYVEVEKYVKSDFISSMMISFLVCCGILDYVESKCFNTHEFFCTHTLIFLYSLKLRTARIANGVRAIPNTQWRIQTIDIQIHIPKSNMHRYLDFSVEPEVEDCQDCEWYEGHPKEVSNQDVVPRVRDWHLIYHSNVSDWREWFRSFEFRRWWRWWWRFRKFRPIDDNAFQDNLHCNVWVVSDYPFTQYEFEDELLKIMNTIDVTSDYEIQGLSQNELWLRSL